MIIVKNKEQIAKMRDAGKIVAEVLALMKEHVAPGVSTWELNEIAENHIRKNGAVPTFLGYGGFPATICASINDEVVHGIPNRNRYLNEGDIISIDVGATFRGYVGDAARTFPVGQISEENARLIAVTRQSFYEGLAQAKKGNRLGDISNAVQRYVEKNGYSVIRDLVGHGVGENMHEDPAVPNYGKKGRGVKLCEGLTIAVEPMVAAGHYALDVLADNWTYVTRDGSMAAHYENTFAITDGEPEILTRL
ncbi:MAG: type I methionyl aminopeptidase [Firmicutes bacterium]|nr:type I methionyl aminopeptidase [Bacillota bacterium]